MLRWLLPGDAEAVALHQEPFCVLVLMLYACATLIFFLKKKKVKTKMVFLKAREEIQDLNNHLLT